MELSSALILDIVVVGIILVSGILAYKNGFIMATLGFVPIIGALLAVKFVTPAVGKFLRGTAFFSNMTESIQNSLRLDEIIGQAAMETQTQLIEGMKLPDFLKESLLENNNPVVYKLLDVESLQEYIAGYLANICINIISVVAVFVVVWIGLIVVLKALNLISELPVLSFVNRTAGLAVGLLKGVSLVWIGAMILTYLQCSGKMEGLFLALSESTVALFMYENNILLYLILTIFT